MSAILAGKTALVTGASRGIGRAIALRLAADGALVCVHYGRNRIAAEAVVDEIAAAGGKAFALGADLAVTGTITGLFAMLDAVLAAHGQSGLDILVNNAGVGEMATIAATDEAAFDRHFDTNVKGTFFVTQAALPRLRTGGRIVMISSTTSFAANPGCIAYAMSKSAINGFARSLAAELGPRGISVNALAPGATETDFIAPLLQNAGIKAAITADIALGRIGQGRDIAGVVAFLCSPDGGWITGDVIAANGGAGL